LLQELHPVSFDLEKLREELLERGRLHLTPLDTPGDDANYIFKHMITREVSYSLLLNNQTKSLNHHGAQAQMSRAAFSGSTSLIR
jgi:hypothetical protein